MARRPVTRSLALRLALAALCAFVLAARVPTDFGRERVRVVTSPRTAADPTLTIDLPDLSELDDAHTAIVVRLRGGATPQVIALTLDGSRVARVSLAAGSESRLDTTVAAPRGTGHVLALTGERGGWQLTYLEFANVHGFTRGIFEVNVIPAAQRQFSTLPWWAVALFAAAVLLLAEPGRLPQGRVPRRVAVGVRAVVIALFVLILFADRVSAFKLLMAPHTFALATALLYSETTLRGLRNLWAALLAALGFVMRQLDPAGAFATSDRVAPAIAAAGALATVVMAWTLGVHTAGGADQYGYAAQSELFARGELFVDQPVAAELPDWVTESVISPLGFTPQPGFGVHGRIVPTYSPGLPLVMAGLRLIGGPDAIYLVVPMLAGLTVWLTFVLGRDLLGTTTGLFAATWLGTSPAFLNSSLAPMSDVPVAAWWLAAFIAALRPSRRAAVAAGMATTLAILTRPNLAMLAAVVAIPYVVRWFKSRATPAAIDAVAFAATAAIGPIAVAVLFNYWYGSPFLSGYGPSDQLFSWSFVGPNLSRYPRWFLETQTAIALAFVAAPLALRSGVTLPGISRGMLAWLMLSFSLLVWLAYVAYIPFEDWWYLRFVLPSYPMLIVLAAGVLVLALRRLPFAGAAGVALLSLLAWHGVSYTVGKGIFLLQRGELRYQKVGEFVGRELPARSLFLAMQHSGSIRYYGSRTTLRYDFLPHDRLDALVAHLQARGWSVYLVLDEWEENQEFRSRFSATNSLGKLDWTPIALSDVGMRVRIYDPRDRGGTTPVVTRRIQ